MKHHVKLLIIALGSATALSSTYGIVNFEATGADNDTIGLTDTFNDDFVTLQFGLDSNGATGGFVRDQTVSLEAVGTDTTSGFINDALGTADVEATSFTPSASSPSLGAFFLRTENLDAGGAPNLFVIEYTTLLTTAASGQIWDIDAFSGDTESFTVRGYGADSGLVATVTSPVGLASSDPASLDGLPWDFAISSITPMKFITIEFTGSKTSGVGLAFDNFNATAVPEPSTYALLIGLVGLGFAVTSKRR